MTSKDELREKLRGGSEARHYSDIATPDGKERVEMIPLEWAEEVILNLLEGEKQKDGLEIELYYLEKLNKVYDDINTGIAKKQSNSTYYINKSIHTETEIVHIKNKLATLNKEPNKGEDV